MRKPEWQAEYEAEQTAETPEQERLRRQRERTVYLVLDCDWEYNDSFYESSEDGITHKAFRSLERAVEYARQLSREGKLYHWRIVEQILEEDEG